LNFLGDGLGRGGRKSRRNSPLLLRERKKGKKKHTLWKGKGESTPTCRKREKEVVSKKKRGFHREETGLSNESIKRCVRENFVLGE